MRIRCSVTPTYDGRGNLTSAGSTTYTYWSENWLKTASNGISIYYDPIGRMSEYDTTVSTRFIHDGDELAAEIDNPAGNILRRYVRGDGVDEPLVWYEGSGTTDRRFLHADERGSIIAVTDSSGNILAKNSYDEYGIPGTGNIGRFQYTGQAWLPELGMYHYKNRIYSTTLGRFLQTDPIGYGDGMNIYAYVGNDPVNFVDPLGLNGESDEVEQEILVLAACQNGGVALPASDGSYYCFNAFEFIDRDWNFDLRSYDRSIDRGDGSGGNEEDDPCAGYDAWKAANDVTDAASQITGAVSDALKTSPAMLSPHGQAAQKASYIASNLTGVANVTTGVYMGFNYGDWKTAQQSVSGFFGGGLLARGYSRWAGAMGYANTDISEAIMRNIGDAVGEEIPIGSSGQCAAR